MAGDGQTSRRWRTKIRPQFRAKCAAENAPCWLCGMSIDYTITNQNDDDVWEPDHMFARSTHPQYAEDPTGLRASHRGCNRTRGNKAANQMLGLGAQSRQWFT